MEPEPIINKTSIKNLTALIACGGKSERMGAAKCMIEYHGTPQYRHLFDMLEPICKQVFISCNESQRVLIGKELETIVDLKPYENSGPIASLLSFHDRYPNQDVLLIGCDYPLLKIQDVRSFLHTLDTMMPAAAFYNNKAAVYEPLLAYYTQDAMSTLKHLFTAGNASLQFFLKRINASKFLPENETCIQSADNPETSDRIKQLIQNGF